MRDLLERRACRTDHSLGVNEEDVRSSRQHARVLAAILIAIAASVVASTIVWSAATRSTPVRGVEPRLSTKSPRQLSDPRAIDQREPASGRSIKDLAEIYGIVISAESAKFPVATVHGAIGGERADQVEIDRYEPVFVAEFSLYPVECIRRSGLRRIVMCRALSFAGQPRTAVPDYQHDTLYLDVCRGAYSVPYVRKVLHHEFFHMIDYRDDGHVYEDAAWSALNGSEFTYGRGGIDAQSQPHASLATTRYPGFLTLYGTTGVEEDKAELFCHLVVVQEYVMERERLDPVLRAKVKRLKDTLIEFCPEMNDAFWERSRSLDRNDNPRRRGR